MTLKHAQVGHVHLQVRDLERSLGFYRDLLGFEVTQRIGDSAAFLSDGGYHHHIGLNTWAGPDIGPASPRHAGLYHVAFVYPSRKELACTLKRLLDAGYPVSGAADHGVAEAIYMQDPDGIGVEIYADRPKDTWKTTPDGGVAMGTDRLDIKGLLAELE